MTFLHPWAIAAVAAAVAAPVLIHWLTRPRPVRLPLSTVRFVFEAVKQRRARLKLRDWIVLVLRVAAVALVGLAFARPLTRGQAAPVVSEENGQTVRVVVLDQSASMGATHAGIAPIDRARPAAARWLDGSGGSRGALVLAAATPRTIFDRPSSNWRALTDEVSAAKALPERLNLPAAIDLAAKLLARGGDGAKRELVVVSDFQRGNWAAADFSPLPKGTTIRLESVAAAQTPANLGVVAVREQGRAERGREIRVEVDVGNYSTAARDVKAVVTVGDATYPVQGLCPPGVVTTLSTVVKPTAAGWLAGEAKLVGVDDALATDNERPFVLEVRPSTTYLLVTREPPKPAPTSSHLLERALVPAVAAHDAAKLTEHVVRVAPENLDRSAIDGADLVVFDHPGSIPQATVTTLASEVRRGKPMLYVAAESVDATNLKLLSDAAGTDLKMPVEFYPPPAGQTRKGLFLTEMKSDRGPFAIFGDALAAATGTLRFGGGLGSRPAPAGAGALADDVLATYSDRSACMVMTACGAGALAVLNADLSASNLPASSAFVPVMGEVVNGLLGQRGLDPPAAPGEGTARFLPAAAGRAEGLVISRFNATAGDAAEFGQLVDEGNGIVWRWDHPGEPGVYQVKRGGATVYAAATALPADESDLTPIDPAVLKGRLAGGRAVSFAAAGLPDDARSRDRVWAWLLSVCAACMVVELFVLKAFRT